MIIAAHRAHAAGNIEPQINPPSPKNELARATTSRLYIPRFLPFHNYTPKSQELFSERSPDKILELTAGQDYCRVSGLTYRDLFRSRGLMTRGF